MRSWKKILSDLKIIGFSGSHDLVAHRQTPIRQLPEKPDTVALKIHIFIAQKLLNIYFYQLFLIFSVPYFKLFSAFFY